MGWDGDRLGQRSPNIIECNKSTVPYLSCQVIYDEKGIYRKHLMHFPIVNIIYGKPPEKHHEKI